MKKAIVSIIFFSVNICFAGNFEREVIDWCAVAILGAGAIGFAYSGPVFDEPLIDGETDEFSDGETVPSEWLYPFALSTTGATLFLPLSDDCCFSRYRAIKGYLEALAIERFSVGLAKDIFGSPRPNAEQRRSNGMLERNCRDSFPSGHASFSFMNATYLSLYSWENIGDNNENSWIIGKSIWTLCLLGTATWVSWTRVDDNVHRPRDVIAGATLGTISACAGYFYEKNRGKKRYDLLLTPINNGVYITIKF